ncbi:MAG: FkbM family methyltransferase [Myxococcales bacterium]|nr:FkbM family methyltransferase [Myxococcales bacterium]
MRARTIAKRFLELPVVNPILRQLASRVPATDTIARIPINLPEVEASIDGARFVMTNPRDCNVARSIYWGRGRPVRKAEATALSIFAASSREAEFVFDVGANTGLFSLLASSANPAARVHSFEIVPVVFAQLVRNIVRNDVARSVEPHLLGVGQPDGAVRVPTGSFGSSLPLSVSLLDRYQTGAEIPVRSLDQLTASLGVRGSLLVKIDVEGAERTVFEHGAETFAKFKPDVVCEILHDSDVPALLEVFLRNNGMRALLIEDEGLRASAKIEPHSHYRDWFLTARSDDALDAMLGPLGLRVLGR